MIFINCLKTRFFARFLFHAMFDNNQVFDFSVFYFLHLFNV